MSILGKIREKTALLLIVIIGGVVLFLVQDAVNSSTSIFASDDNSVGEFHGESVHRKEYDTEMDKLKYSFQVNQGKTPNEFEQRRLQNEAWSRLIFSKVFTVQFDELGLEITKGQDGEEVDMVQGVTVHPSIVQQFTDPNTRSFDVNRIKQFLVSIADPKTQEAYMAKAQWDVFKENLIQDRLRSKYVDLLAKSNFVTKAEAKRSYELANTTSDVEYLYVDYASISDTTELKDSDYDAYIKQYAYKYKPEETRVIDYVVFDALATGKDTAEILNGMLTLKEAFVKATNDTFFVQTKAQTSSAPSYVKEDALPYSLKMDSSFKVQKGLVFGPYLEGQYYKLYKITDYKKNDSTFKAKASHILLSINPNASDEEKTTARIQAQQILDRALAGEDFATLAAQFSQDPGSKDKGGDLGEFGKGQMVPPFESAIFGAKKEGVVASVVETQFGYHIINVTQKSKLESVQSLILLSTVDKEIAPTKATRDAVYRDANIFLSSLNNLSDLKSKSAEKGYKLETAERITQNSYGFGKFYSDGRSMVRWSFTEGKVGEVSPEIYSVNNSYIIIGLAAETKKDDVSAENLKSLIEPEVRNFVKANKVKAELEKAGDNFQVAARTLNDVFKAQVAKADLMNIKFSDLTVGNAGQGPEFVGVTLGQNEGQISGVILGETGAMRVRTSKKFLAPAKEEFSAEKQSILSSIEYRDSYLIEQALQEDAEIVDERYKFF